MPNIVMPEAGQGTIQVFASGVTLVAGVSGSRLTTIALRASSGCNAAAPCCASMRPQPDPARGRRLPPRPATPPLRLWTDDY